MPRDDYDHVAWAVCERCGLVHSYMLGFQGDMRHCRECGADVIHTSYDEAEARRKSKEIKDG